MRHAQPSPVEARERGLQRLRGWTTASAVLAAGLGVAFAFLAAATFPGRSAAASSAPAAQSSNDQGEQPASGDQGVAQAQAPPGGFFGSGSGSSGQRSVRSGGS